MTHEESGFVCLLSALVRLAVYQAHPTNNDDERRIGKPTMGILFVEAPITVRNNRSRRCIEVGVCHP